MRRLADEKSKFKEMKCREKSRTEKKEIILTWFSEKSVRYAGLKNAEAVTARRKRPCHLEYFFRQNASLLQKLLPQEFGHCSQFNNRCLEPYLFLLDLRWPKNLLRLRRQFLKQFGKKRIFIHFEEQLYILHSDSCTSFPKLKKTRMCRREPPKLKSLSVGVQRIELSDEKLDKKP